MSGHLLDTNVVLETMGRVPHSQVVTFLTEHDDLWLSTIVLHELKYDVRLMERGLRQAGLQANLASFTMNTRIASCPWTGPRRRGQPNSEHSRNVSDARWNWVTPS